MNDNYPYGGAPYGSMDEQRGGVRTRGSYGAPDREREMHRGYNAPDREGRYYERNRHNEGWRGFVEDRPWRQAGRDEGGARGMGNHGRQAWPGRDAGDNYGGTADHGSAYRGNNYQRSYDDYRDSYRSQDNYHGQDSYGSDYSDQRRYARGNYRDQGGRDEQDGAGERFGQWSSPNQWGQQGYGQPYSQRDWGARDYHRDSSDWGRQDEGWQNHPQREGNYYDASRSSQGNRRYPNFADAYTGETHGRQWGAFGGAGFGSTGTDGGSSEESRSAVHHRGRGPKGYQRSDERIKEDICERLTHDPYIDASEITVECRGGVVTLEGHIERRAMKHRVEDMVDAVSGVRDVQNRLIVASGRDSDALSQPRSGNDSRVGAGVQEQQQATTGAAGTPADTRSTQQGVTGSATTGGTTTGGTTTRQ